jgi:diadenosine tetraphosphate (Ap4A) HIT family hydrolase
VFCRILRGELAKTLVDEGKHCVVMLDRNQAARGHLLVIPKVHVAVWHELDALVVAEMTDKSAPLGSRSGRGGAA